MEKKQNKKHKYRKWIILIWSVFVLGIFCVIFVMTCAAKGWLTFPKLPDLAQLENPKSDLASEVYTADGKVIGRYFSENRVNVPYDSLSLNIVHALVATEDQRFYQHSGVDLRGILRAVFMLGSDGGGSTITQQLAKMLFNAPTNSTYERIKQKLQEWIISVELERHYTKDEIIDMYLNRLDFVNNAVGIKTAAHVYFDKSQSQLTISEAAMLVGMAKNPALFNPIIRPDTVKFRRNVALHQMYKNDYITEAAFDSLSKLPLGLRYEEVDHKNGIAPYFREILRAKLGDLFSEKDSLGHYVYHKKDGTPYNIYTDGLKIYTTLDTRYQKAAEWAVKTHVKNLQKHFWEALKHKRNAPFDWRLSKKQIHSIMMAAVHRSARYRILMGQQCANCGRRGDDIKVIYKKGVKYFQCQASDCGFETPAPKDSIMSYFNKPVKMKVFTWHGEIDTTMTPLDSIRYYKSFLQAGLMSIDPHTGYIKAWVGGINFKHFAFDHVIQAKRQVGSSFKPFVYSLAIREGIPPCKLIPNIKYTFYKGEYGLQKDWTPVNAENEYGYNVTLKYALANSLNTVTAWIMKQFGPQAVVDIAHKMGITTHLNAVPSLCLGTTDLSLYEMVGAYADFANQGIWIQPTMITRIEDKNGNVIVNVVPKSHEALDEKTAYIMTNMLEAVVDGAYNKHLHKATGTAMRLRGTPSKARPYVGFRNPMGGKTGTTQNNSDGWYFGITPDLVTGVWVGANDRSVHFTRTYFGQGANTGLPIWGYYMHKIYDNPTIKISKGDFEKPEKPINIELNCKQYNKDQNPNDFGSKGFGS